MTIPDFLLRLAAFKGRFVVNRGYIRTNDGLCRCPVLAVGGCSDFSYNSSLRIYAAKLGLSSEDTRQIAVAADAPPWPTTCHAPATCELRQQMLEILGLQA